MKILFRKGYSVYKGSDNGIVIATPHSGPALLVPTGRDDNSETVASLCWRRMGGTLVISNITRKRLYGIDFNRDIPSKDLAIKMFPEFKENEDSKKVYDYGKRYAFVAENEEDYDQRLNIYQNFWYEVSKGKYIILVHRIFPRIKALPTILDIITFKDEGIKRNVISEIVKELNSKYYNFLKRVENPYKKMIMFEEERTVANIIKTYRNFDLNKMDGEFRENLERDLEKIKKYSSPMLHTFLEKRFTPQNFLKAVNSALINAPMPEITIENVYSGDLAFAPRRKLFPTKGKIVIEVEASRFLNFWYPEITSDIICHVLDRIK